MSFRRGNLFAVAPPLPRIGNRDRKFPAVNVNAQPAGAAFDARFKRFAGDQYGIHFRLNLLHVSGYNAAVDAEVKLHPVALDFKIARAISDAQFEFHLLRGSVASCSRRPVIFQRDTESFDAGRGAEFTAIPRFMCQIAAATTAASSIRASRLPAPSDSDFCDDAAETGAAERSKNSSSHFV